MTCATYLQFKLKWGRKQGGKQAYENKIVDDYEKANALLSDVILNYKTVITLGQKNIDLITKKFETLLDSPSSLKQKNSVKAGILNGIGESGRLVFFAIAFWIGLRFCVD